MHTIILKCEILNKCVYTIHILCILSILSLVKPECFNPFVQQLTITNTSCCSFKDIQVSRQKGVASLASLSKWILATTKRTRRRMSACSLSSGITIICPTSLDQGSTCFFFNSWYLSHGLQFMVKVCNVLQLGLHNA